MKPRKTHLTSQIKPSTRDALAAQFAAAADEIILLRGQVERALACARAWREIAEAKPRTWRQRAGRVVRRWWRDWGRT